MGIFFDNKSLKRLSGEQFATLNNLADIAAAENINEEGSGEQDAVKNYIADLAKKEQAEAERAKDLVNSFI